MTYATSQAWTLLSGDGTKTVYAQFSDNAGNVTTTNISATIILDIIADAKTEYLGTTVSPTESITAVFGDSIYIEVAGQIVRYRSRKRKLFHCRERGRDRVGRRHGGKGP